LQIVDNDLICLLMTTEISIARSNATSLSEKINSLVWFLQHLGQTPPPALCKVESSFARK